MTSNTSYFSKYRGHILQICFDLFHQIIVTRNAISNQPHIRPHIRKKGKTLDLPCVLILFSYTRNKPKNSSTAYIMLTHVTNGRVIKAGCQMLPSHSGILAKIYFVAWFRTRYHPSCNAAHRSKHLLILVFF